MRAGDNADECNSRCFHQAAIDAAPPFFARGAYFGVIPIVGSHLSTSLGHSVIGNSVRLNPNA